MLHTKCTESEFWHKQSCRIPLPSTCIQFFIDVRMYVHTCVHTYVHPSLSQTLTFLLQHACTARPTYIRTYAPLHNTIPHQHQYPSCCRACSGSHLLKQVALAVLGNEMRAPFLVVFLQHLSTVLKDDLTQEIGEAVAG